MDTDKILLRQISEKVTPIKSTFQSVFICVHPWLFNDLPACICGLNISGIFASFRRTVE